MRLCGGCQTKIPDDTRGVCATCERERYGKQPSDGIRSNVPAGQLVGKQHTQAGYDAAMDKLCNCKRWDDKCAKVRGRDGSCVMCKAEGRPPTPIALVDHIIPAQHALAQCRAVKPYPFGADWNAGYYLDCNLQGLCRSCHAVKTLKDLSTNEWPNVMDVYNEQPKKVWSF